MNDQKIQKIQEILDPLLVQMRTDHPLISKLGSENLEFLTKAGLPVGSKVLDLLSSGLYFRDPDNFQILSIHNKEFIRFTGGDHRGIGCFPKSDKVYLVYQLMDDTIAHGPKIKLINTTLENFMYCLALYFDAATVESKYSYQDMKKEFQLLEPDLPFREPESYWDDMDHFWDNAILRELGEIY
ncbi:hypothetical protein [Deinococcus roseus]|uniref:SUKH-4 immunity protein n=1 Tax=Deinococcus roseus TaxID=392414 RepID=A0ABQ2CUF6_9DEIO|nr:hypothetical protein [Deinococcus roseus]GGJ21363.1 hypothetical protein GCM10008938_04500 [Deinococcus roseus]